MTKLFLTYVVVGQAGSDGVEIDDVVPVWKLKRVIMENENRKGRGYPELLLFLAKEKKKKNGNDWLDEVAAEAVAVNGRNHPLGFEQMLSSAWLNDARYFGENFQPDAGQIHVLVVPLEGRTGAEVKRSPKLSTFAMLLKNSNVIGDLPQQGEFLELLEWTDDDCGKVVDITPIGDLVEFAGSKFYVRKEIIRVLQIFKRMYQEELDAGKVGNKQLVLMGSPGMGKSCILALMCFYVAVRCKRPVLWFRKVRGGFRLTATRLFYKGKYYEWIDDNGKIFESIYDAMEASDSDPDESWFCLDGMDQLELKEKKWLNSFKLLATSGEFPLKSDAVESTKKCLVPYWRRTDLEDFGLNHMQMSESDFDARFFASGGNLTNFVYDCGKAVSKDELTHIAGPGDAEMLLRASRASSGKQIDFIRMRGVQNVNKIDHYKDIDRWSYCVTSKFVLHRLGVVVMPDFFERLMRIAKEMNDDRVEDAAFEEYFHSLVRHRRSIRVEYCKYDNVDRTTGQDWEAIMSEDAGSIELSGPSLVKCKGGSTSECVAVMESWAANPSTMNYWIPETSLCEAIDAVARWTFPDGVERFCFLQLTKATTHKCDAAILWELAQPFVNLHLQVCYLALLPDEDKRRMFRLNPAVITQQTVLDHFRLYVAHFK